jgi:hypothetical protein
VTATAKAAATDAAVAAAASDAAYQTVSTLLIATHRGRQ